MKKIFGYFLGFALTTSFLASAASQTTLSMTINDDIFMRKWADGLKAGYEKLHPDITVKINSVISKGSEYHTKLAISLPMDETTDVLWIDDQQYHNFIKSRFICKIPEIKTRPDFKAFDPTIMNAHMYENEFYAQPMNAVVVGLFYNKDIFKKAGLPVPWQPKTWQDVYDAAKTIKEKVPKVWPLYLDLSPEASLTNTFRTILMLLYGTKDGALINKDNKWIGTSQGLLDTYTFIKKAIDDNLTIPKNFMFSMEPQSVEKKYFPAGKVAIDLDGCWICRFYTGDMAKVKDFMDFAPMPTQFGQDPKYVTLQGDWLLTISDKSKHKKEATDFILFASNYENSLEYAKIMSDLTPRVDIFADKSFPAELKIFEPYLVYSRYRPFAEQYPAAGNEISSAIRDAVVSNSTPFEAMNNYAKNLELTLGKENVVREYKEK